MRVIGGTYRSRKLKSPPGEETRPTPDRLRESLFNILAPQIGESVFVDAYAGGGSVGIEALSRGARRAVFIERSRGNVAVIQDNLRALGVAAERVRVIHGGAGTFLAGIGAEADIVFFDPPYDRPAEYDTAFGQLGATQALVIAQHATREVLAERYGELERYRTVRQGDNCLSFYRRRPSGA